MSLTFKVARLGTTSFQADTGPATGSWTSISNLVNSQANLAGNYLANQSWIVIGILEDKFTRTEFMVNVATESVVFSYDRSGVGVNKIRERGALDVKGDIFANDQPIQQYQLSTNIGAPLWFDGKPNVTNANLLDAPGQYYIANNAIGNPNKQWGYLFQYSNYGKNTDGYKEAIQLFYGNNGQVYFRHHRWSKTIDDWEGWKEYVTKDDLQKIATRKIELGWFINGNVTRNGNLVTISTERKITDIATISDYREIKETIPAGFRPAQEVDLVLQGLSDSTVTGTAILHLAVDGKIRLTSKSPGNKYWTGTVTYITNDPYP